jgi:sugar O-acyltransferase (sialic acid O-acetyltransferase NeuD family)
VRTFVYGASGHGKVVLDILLCCGVSVDGFIDDGQPMSVTMGPQAAPNPGTLRVPSTLVLGLPIVGDGDWLAAEAKKAEKGSLAVALGIGDNAARQRISRRCVAAGVEVVSAVHPAAVVARSAVIGGGAVLMAGAVVNPDAVIGTGAIVNTGAVVEHDCSVGIFAHISPNAALGGAARVGDLSHVGLCAAVLPGKAVGARSIVGAGAVVTRDLPDDVVAAGVPARVLRRLQVS